MEFTTEAPLSGSRSPPSSCGRLCCPGGPDSGTALSAHCFRVGRRRFSYWTDARLSTCRRLRQQRNGSSCSSPERKIIARSAWSTAPVSPGTMGSTHERRAKSRLRRSEATLSLYDRRSELEPGEYLVRGSVPGGRRLFRCYEFGVALEKPSGQPGARTLS